MPRPSKPRPSRAKPGKARAKKRLPGPAQLARAAVQEVPETETAAEAITRIAQDAVVILRRELAYRAELSMLSPGRISMSDCIALLRLTTDLGEAAKRGADGDAPADYSRLSPDERAQLATLLLKVDYA